MSYEWSLETWKVFAINESAEIYKYCHLLLKIDLGYQFLDCNVWRVAQLMWRNLLSHYLSTFLFELIGYIQGQNKRQTNILNGSKWWMGQQDSRVTGPILLWSRPGQKFQGKKQVCLILSDSFKYFSKRKTRDATIWLCKHTCKKQSFKNSKVANLASSLRVFGTGRAAVVSGRPRPSPLSRPVMVGQDHVQTFCQDRGHDYVHKCQDSFSNTR